MKFMSRSLALLLLVTIFATPAFAENNKKGIYAGIKLIDSIQGNWIDDGGDLSGFQNTIGGGIFVGYDFYHKFDVPVRMELEYALRSEWSTDQDYSVGGVRATAKAMANVQTLLANFYYDFRNSSNFTPYVGLGLGVAFIEASVDASLTTPWGWAAGSVSDSETAFAWNIGAGVAYNINDTVTIDLGYRYLNLGDSKFKFNNLKASAFSAAHEIMLGLRFTF